MSELTKKEELTEVFEDALEEFQYACEQYMVHFGWHEEVKEKKALVVHAFREALKYQEEV